MGRSDAEWGGVMEWGGGIMEWGGEQSAKLVDP